ncbi:oligosaccharide binding [Desmophyllum pertusum]|uniref:Oligosaccharide binding n=1 Tax=Desmophyllum pertusum TaxID=174260 RepID=A0A9W9YMF1_9CNID|nr:oligosaccharide binding [Desmophyllum pertusum]
MPNIAIILFVFTAWSYRLTEAGDGAMCKMKTKDNKCCVFPFVYRGTTYNTCITIRSRTPWCALSPSYDQDKKYGYCRGMEGKITGDDQAWIYANGKYLGNDNGRWNVPMSFYFPADLQVVAIYVKNSGGLTGLIGSFANGIVTDSKWKCTTQPIRNWHTIGFDDSNWPAATIHSDNSGNMRANGAASNAKWIGPSNRHAGGFYCRRHMTYFGEKPTVGGSCDKPLGLQSGWVENSQMRASSSWDAKHAAWRGRLHMPKQHSFTGAWCSRAKDVNQWLEVRERREAFFLDSR